jgi:hypothetical protein
LSWRQRNDCGRSIGHISNISSTTSAPRSDPPGGCHSRLPHRMLDQRGQRQGALHIMLLGHSDQHLDGAHRRVRRQRLAGGTTPFMRRYSTICP